MAVRLPLKTSGKRYSYPWRRRGVANLFLPAAALGTPIGVLETRGKMYSYPWRHRGVTNLFLPAAALGTPIGVPAGRCQLGLCLAPAAGVINLFLPMRHSGHSMVLATGASLALPVMGAGRRPHELISILRDASCAQWSRPRGPAASVS